MMDFITVPLTTGIVVLGFYKLIELFARKKERILLVEKLSTLQNFEAPNINLSGLFGENNNLRGKFMTLRIGSLLVGLGLGLLIGFLIGQLALGHNFNSLNTDIYYRTRNLMSLIYGASTLLFGGLGLITGFIVEHKISGK